MKNPKKDDTRTKFLESEGFKVIRIWDNEALANIEGTLEYIRRQLQKSPSPRPSPLEGEGVKK
jgi:very-short-patch-repair endonuclease